MHLRRVKFIWGASQVIRGRWFLGLFGFYNRVEGERDGGIAISVRGLLAWAAVFAVMLYVAGATALFWIWQRSPYTLLTYSDALLYPVRRAEITAKKGQAFNAQGFELFRAGKYHEAANILRLGLARYPGDFRARLTLAHYYMLANQRALALRILQEGLTDEYPGRSYLETLFSTAEQGEDYVLVESVSSRYLPHLHREGSPHDHRWLLDRKFAALQALKRHTDALALAENAGAGDTAMEQRVLALLALERPSDALQLLAEWRARPGVDPKVVVRLQVRALREAQRFEEMTAALSELRQLIPAEPSPLVYAVVQQQLAGRATEACAAFDDYLFRFSGTAANLMMLAEPLAEIGELDLLNRCLVAAKERGYPLHRFRVALVQLHVQRGEWQAATRVLAAMPPETGTTREATSSKVWRDWTERLIEAAKGAGDGAQLALTDFLRQRPWPLPMFLKTSDALRRAEQLETAREVQTIATRMYPASATLQADVADVDEKLAARAAAAASRSERDIARTAAKRMTQEMFFEQLDRFVAEKRWSESLKHIQDARSSRPALEWMDAHDAPLRLVQVRASQGTGDFSGMIGAARIYLNGDPTRSQQLLDAASEFAATGDKESAVRLTREIIRRVPDFKPAQRLLAVLQPPPEPEKNSEENLRR